MKETKKTANRKANVGDFVFWKYQRGFMPETYLGGIVTKVHPSGRLDGFVSVDGYGTMCFRPVYVTDPKTGAELYKLLRAAEKGYDAAVDAAASVFTHVRDNLFNKQPRRKRKNESAT